MLCGNCMLGKHWFSARYSKKKVLCSCYKKLVGGLVRGLSFKWKSYNSYANSVDGRPVVEIIFHVNILVEKSWLTTCRHIIRLEILYKYRQLLHSTIVQ